MPRRPDRRSHRATRRRSPALGRRDRFSAPAHAVRDRPCGRAPNSRHTGLHRSARCRPPSPGSSASRRRGLQGTPRGSGLSLQSCRRSSIRPQSKSRREPRSPHHVFVAAVRSAHGWSGSFSGLCSRALPDAAAQPRQRLKLTSPAIRLLRLSSTPTTFRNLAISAFLPRASRLHVISGLRLRSPIGGKARSILGPAGQTPPAGTTSFAGLRIRSIIPWGPADWERLSTRPCASKASAGCASSMPR